MSGLDSKFFLKRRFRDFYEFAYEARAWDLEFLQLDVGEFRGELLQFGVGAVQLARARFNRLLDQRGSPPPGLRTFAVLANPAAHLVWRGREIPQEAVMAFPPGAELDAVSRPGFDVFTLSFSEELLAEVSRTLGLPELADLLCGADVVSCNRAMVRGLRRSLSRICQELSQDPSKLADPWLHQELEFELPRQLLNALMSSKTGRHSPSSRLRDLALKRARAYLTECAAEPLTVRDLCRATEVSERTLQYAFLERFGVSPKAYLKALRLNGARRDLKRADPAATKVSDVANHWGFWHLGQFAADYRRLFAEFPSDTVRQSAWPLTERQAHF